MKLHSSTHNLKANQEINVEKAFSLKTHKALTPHPNAWPARELHICLNSANFFHINQEKTPTFFMGNLALSCHNKFPVFWPMHLGLESVEHSDYVINASHAHSQS